MEATLDLTRASPDYMIELTKKEILDLSRGKCILGNLIFTKKLGDEPENPLLLISFVSGKKVRMIKKFLREKNQHFCEGPHVTIIRTNSEKVHEVIYTKEDMENPKILLKGSAFRGYFEHRFDSHIPNKIFLYYDGK